MSNMIEPGAGLLYMKVGTHAQESLTDIIKRKRKEIEAAGHAFWGYGGNTCHPSNTVQPFVKAFEQQGKTIYLCMEEIISNHTHDPIRADEFSVNGIDWHEIPIAINALGSRHALVIDKLEAKEFALPLTRTRVAWGNSRGANGDTYIRGRVDKGCLELVDESADDGAGRIAQIGLVARIVKPYAVFLRNRSNR
jgi:hypothetical protein